MVIYRYENKNTGDGPFMTLNGYSKIHNTYFDNGGYLYGCQSRIELINLMREYQQYDRPDYHIVEYTVLDKDVIVNRKEVLFPKFYSPFYKKVPVTTIPDETGSKII